MADIEAGAVDTAPVDSPAPETPVTEAPDQQQAEPSVDDELNDIWAKNNPERDATGKFASKEPEKADEGLEEGKPESDAIETAKPPSIEAPNSLPSELKAQWASVPPAMQEHIAKREAEAHRQITQLGQQAKAYEPFGKLVETNRDVFQNQRRNVEPMAGISQLLEAQRQLDRDPVASIAHIARVYGVDLTMFANQSGEASNQSPHVASLLSQNQHLETKIAQLEQLVLTREQREAQASKTALESLISDFQKTNPIDDDMIPSLTAQIEVLHKLNPELSQKEVLEKAYEAAIWTNPARREQLTVKQRAADEARKAEEAKKRAAEAKRAGSVNVRSSPGSTSAKPPLDDELTEIWRRNQSA